MRTTLLLIFGLCLGNLPQASANDLVQYYPDAKSNHELREELEGEEHRKIPSNDWFVAGVDGEAYIRTSGTEEFYHGAGYWVQGRTEIQPYENFILNTRSIFFSGSISYGYAAPADNYHLIGFTGIFPTTVLGGQLKARGIDLERQTVGNGLFIEQDEIGGISLDWLWEHHSIRLMADGTGGLARADDMWNLEFALFDRAIGFGTLYWVGEAIGTRLEEDTKDMAYVFSEYELFEDFSYIFDFGYRNEAHAGLLGFLWDYSGDRFRLNSRIQYRFYEKNFADKFERNIDHVYVSYDQYAKRYTNFINVISVDDDVQVYSLELNMDYKISDQFGLHSMNEAGQFNYVEFPDDTFFFYRAGMTWWPRAGRPEHLNIFVSNKVLSNSFSIPPYSTSFANNAAFKDKIQLIGLEGRFQF